MKRRGFLAAIASLVAAPVALLWPKRQPKCEAVERETAPVDGCRTYECAAVRHVDQHGGIHYFEPGAHAVLHGHEAVFTRDQLNQLVSNGDRV